MVLKFLLELLCYLCDTLQGDDHLVRHTGLEQGQNSVRVLHLFEGVKVCDVVKGRNSKLLLV